MSVSNNTRPTIDSIIQMSREWSLFDAGVLLALTPDGYGFLDKHFISDAELATVHEKLPHAMRAIFEYNLDYGLGPIVLGSEVRETLTVLRGKTLTFDDGKNKYTFSVLESIEPGDSPPEVVLHGVTLRIAERQTLVGPIVIAARHGSTQLPLVKNQLETQYPGWEKRIEIGIQLGLFNGVLFEYAFSKETTPKVCRNLNDITF